MLPTTMPAPRIRYPASAYCRNSSLIDVRPNRLTDASRRDSTAPAALAEPKPAWYGCRASGTVGSESRTIRESATRSDPPARVSSTALAHPDLTVRPSAATSLLRSRRALVTVTLGKPVAAIGHRERT